MKCQKCKINQATIFYKEIINDEVKEIYLCYECAKNYSFIESPEYFMMSSIEDFLKQLLPHTESQKSCEVCGMRFEDFKQKGKLGCPNCYNVFEDELIGILQKIHGSVTHVGSVPIYGGGDLKIKREIERLKKQMEIVIKEEKFEEAAKIRDKIRELEKKLKELKE